MLKKVVTWNQDVEQLQLAAAKPDCDLPMLNTGGTQLMTMMSRGSHMQPSKLLEDNKTTCITMLLKRNCSQCHTRTALGETATQFNCTMTAAMEMRHIHCASSATHPAAQHGMHVAPRHTHGSTSGCGQHQSALLSCMHCLAT